MSLRSQDPTSTLTLRRRLISSINKRFLELKTKIRKYLVEENRLDSVVVNIFKYSYMVEKHTEFMNWLKEQEEKGVLELIVGNVPFRNIPRNQPWINTFLWTAYQKGLTQGRTELRAQGKDVPVFMRTDAFVSSPLFHAPFHSEAVGLLFTRAYIDLKGITEAMDSQISRVLAQGMTDGLSPRQIAKNINSKVDSIGRNRARTLARTEIIKAYNDAKLNDYSAMESVVGEDIFVKWWTAQDERVRRPRHTSRHGKIYKKEDASRLLGEPNCRCALRPYLISVNGEISPSQWGPINPLEGR